MNLPKVLPMYKLPLETALDETPEVSSFVNSCINDVSNLRSYMDTLHQISSNIVSQHNKLTSSYQQLAEHFERYSSIKKSVYHDSQDCLAANLQNFSEIASEMSSWEHINATQISDGVLYPIAQFINTELMEISKMTDLYRTASSDVDRSISRYGRIRRKDSQLDRQDAKEDVYKSRKKFHYLALQLYGKLNKVQMESQLALLRPALGLVTASRSFHHLGQESLSSRKNEEFLSTTGVSLKRLGEKLQSEEIVTEELIESIVNQSQFAYYPMPSDELANLPPDTTLSFKSGYLNVHRKYMGVMSSWERQFVYIKQGKLLIAHKSDINPTLLLELDPTTLAHATDTDDRMHVFAVTSFKKCVTVQAINDRERDEWMLTIQNHIKDGGASKMDKSETSNSLFSGMGQFFSDRLHAASAAVSGGSTPEAPMASSQVPPNIPTSIRGDVINKDERIVFDILIDSDEEDEEDQSTNETSDVTDAKLEVKSFNVYFLGSMAVQVDSVESFLVGQNVVYEVMDRIMLARNLCHNFNVMTMVMHVSPSHLTLKDPANCVRLKQSLKDVSFWAAGSEDQKSFGYIAKQEKCYQTRPSGYSCFVFQSEDSGKDVCSALGAAARMTYAHLLDQKVQKDMKKAETKILLQNIAQLPDKMTQMMTADGSSLVLDDNVAAAAAVAKKMDKSVRRSKFDSDA